MAGQEKFAEAEPLLIAGYDGLIRQAKKIPAPASGRTPEAIARLVQLYTAWQKPQEAAEWQKKLEQAKETTKASSE